MDTKTAEDLSLVRGIVAAAHRDTRSIAKMYPCPELNLAEKYLKMAAEAMNAKLRTVDLPETETEPTKADVVYFIKQLNAENPK
jgi:hypothetical protein